jgi:hypothetical protein
LSHISAEVYSPWCLSSTKKLSDIAFPPFLDLITHKVGILISSPLSLTHLSVFPIFPWPLSMLHFGYIDICFKKESINYI